MMIIIILIKAIDRTLVLTLDTPSEREENSKLVKTGDETQLRHIEQLSYV